GRRGEIQEDGFQAWILWDEVAIVKLFSRVFYDQHHRQNADYKNQNRQAITTGWHYESGRTSFAFLCGDRQRAREPVKQRSAFNDSGSIFKCRAGSRVVRAHFKPRLWDRELTDAGSLYCCYRRR